LDVCPDIGLSRSAPATAEVATFGSLGASHDGSTWSVAGGGGTELTFGGKLWRGFPSGPYGKENSFAELRAGPWFQAIVRAHGVVYEVGPKVHLGATYHASWGTFDVRPAIGTGEFATGRSALTSLTLAYGVHSEPGRYYTGGACVGPNGLWGVTPEEKPKAFGLASVLNVFGTYRRATDLPAWEVVVGIEVSPTWALPPYSWSRLIGFPP
jgi:hypothetical protein